MDLLDTVLKKDTLFLEELQVKVEFQNNDLSVWHDVIYGLNENLKACIQLKVKHSAFDLMMRQTIIKKLPQPKIIKFHTDLLFNDLLKILREKELGWLNNNHLTIGNSFINKITNLVWYLDPHHHKLEKRGLRLPNLIANLPEYISNSNYNLYYHNMKHKKVKISHEKLDALIQSLNISLQQPWTSFSYWKEIIQEIHHLVQITQDYSIYLKGINVRMKSIHTSLVPARNARDDIFVKDYEAHDVYPPQYKPLVTLLKESNYYEILNIDDLLTSKPQENYLYFKIYVLIHLSLSSSSVMKVLYQDLTGDVSKPNDEQSKDIQERMKLMLDTQDPDIMIDLRKTIGERSTKFDIFWDEMEDYFNENSPSVHERSHTTTLYMPIAMSVNDLLQTILERLRNKYNGDIPPEIEIPSNEWVRLQFWPKSEFARSRNTGRFRIRYKVQARQLCKFHVDAHYCAALWKNFCEFSIKFKDHTTLICADDKHKVPIGEFVATSTGIRNKQSITPLDGILNSSDHDFTKLSLTPSVSLFVDIPNEITESFYKGQVYVAYKDTILQPSSALRHSTEFYNNYCAQFQNHLAKPKILLLYTDAAVQTAPYHSWANPAECMMSILNLALQGVALKRESMNIRIGSEKNSIFKEELIESMKKTQDFLNERTSHLSLHDTKFRSSSPALESDIETLFASILLIEEQITINDTTSVELKGFQKLKNFMSTHCQIRQYSFQVKKCNRNECRVCLPIELPIEVYNNFHFLPDPEPSISDPDHYREFSSIYGTQTSEKFRPSKLEQPEATLIEQQISALRLKIDENNYTCGIEGWMLTSQMLQDVAFTCQSITCDSPIENGYYSSRKKKPPICYYCGRSNLLVEINNDLLNMHQIVYPLCSNCELAVI
ncbi:4992_t:CDS:2 [Entrophospora sp. SA101]|nr:4992_t:CDS:2 [Entrophospora sp. SA101]